MDDLGSEAGDVAALARTHMRRPEGSTTFRSTLPWLLDREVPQGLVLEVVAGPHVFRVLRDDQMQLRFFHASPGTGTRVASLSLEGFDPAAVRFFFGLVWSPDELRLHCGADGGVLATAVGTPAGFQLRVGRDGSVFQLGSDGAEVRGVRVVASGQEIVAPSAIDLWSDIRWASEAQLAVEPQDYLHEVVTSNAVLSGLVTGFETYLQGRFLELDAEGVPCDQLSVARAMLSKQEREAIDERGLIVLDEQASDAKLPVVEYLTRRINFQSYDRAKEAYKRGYGLKFGDAGNSQLLGSVQQLLEFRHRIIHVSPLLGMLNSDSVPPDEPIFSSRAFATGAVETFGEFVRSVHEGSLRLRPPS